MCTCRPISSKIRLCRPLFLQADGHVLELLLLQRSPTSVLLLRHLQLQLRKAPCKTQQTQIKASSSCSSSKHMMHTFL